MSGAWRHTPGGARAVEAVLTQDSPVPDDAVLREEARTIFEVVAEAADRA